MVRLWTLGVSLFFLALIFTSPAARLLWLLVRVIELVETFQSLVELNHGKINSARFGNLK
jgi:hypothetical protein